MQKKKYLSGFVLLSFFILYFIFSIISCDLVSSSDNEPVSSESFNSDTTGEIDSSSKITTVTETVPATSNDGDLSVVISSGRTNPEHKQVALTFDSGWEYENTGQLLDILDEYNIKATFFTRGLWARDHPDIAADIVYRGHDLENHSLTHGHMTEMGDDEVRNEISETTNIIKKITGFNADLFRPPYGEYDERILRILNEEGYPYTIMWTIDSHDWASELNGIIISEDYVIKRVLENATDGSIILMHVGGYETVNALPEIINGLSSKGYYFVKVKDIL